MEQLEHTTDYTLFDAEWFFENFYAGEEAQENLLDDTRRVSLLFEKYNIGGKRLLDVGTGPCIYSVITASLHVEEIYLSDFAPSNLCFLKKWLNGEKHTPTKLLQGMLEEEKSSLSLAERENYIRQKVKGILYIDVNKPNPLGDWNGVREFDVVISSGCLECATLTIHDFEQALVNVSTLLKVGGCLLLSMGLEAGNYQVGNYCFRSLSISRSEMETAITKAGLIVQHASECLPSEQDLKFDEFSSWCDIIAIKQ